MIKKLICILILGIELAACKQAADKKPVMPTTDPTEQSAAITDPTQYHIDTVAASVVPPGPPGRPLSGKEIRPLPFGPAGSTAKDFFKKDPWFYYRLIGDGYTLSHNYFKKFTPTYPLPPIEKYTHATDEWTRDYCNYGDRQIPVDSLLTIKHYRVRLPDYKGFEVYYTTGDAAVDSLFPQKYFECEMNYKLYGFLIFYERATKTAHLLAAFYYWYGESDHSRQFYIDSNYRIFTYSEWMYESDGGEADIDAGPVFEVTINSKGEFTTKALKKQRTVK